MALVFNDRVKETSVTTGTGTLTLDGAVQGFETFSSAIGNSNTTYYAIELPGTTEFEVGRGTVSAGQLARTQVISSSNSDSPVDFSAGTKIVFCTLPASKAVIKDASGNIPIDANKTIEFGDSGETISGDGTNLTIASGSQTIVDSTGNIQLKVGSASGALELDIGGTSIAKFENSSNTVQLRAIVQDKDIEFRGNDGGSQITALSLDMSEAGAATFNDNVLLGSGKQLKFHTVGDNIKFDGTNLLITATNGLLLDGDQQIMFNDGGQNYGAFVNSSTRFTLHSQRSDVDFAINVNDGGSQLDALIFDASEAGAATFNSTVTANAGLKADNITIDGTEIDLSSGDLTIDVAGDLNIDAGGGDIFLKDDGTTFAALRKESNGQLQIQSGSGPTTVLTFDSAQKATFASNVAIGDNLFLHSDASEIRFGVNSDVTLAHVHDTGLLLNANRQLQFGDAGENISGDGTDLTIASSNDATIDVAGQINLDASDIGRIHLMHDGTTYAHILRSGQNLEIKSSISDGDFEVHGNDGGASINAFKLDMSEAGAATFNDKVILGANKVIEFGDSGETISGDGTDMTVSSSGILNLNSSAATGPAIRLASSAGGISVESNSLIVLDAHNADNGIQYKDGATEMLRIHNSSSDVILHTKVQDKDLIFKGNDGGSDITALTLDMSEAGAATFNAGITATTGTFSGTVTANGEVLTAGVSAGFAVAMAIAL